MTRAQIMMGELEARAEEILRCKADLFEKIEEAEEQGDETGVGLLPDEYKALEAEYDECMETFAIYDRFGYDAREGEGYNLYD